MKTDRNITLKDGTNLTLKGGGFEQSIYGEEIEEIGIAEFIIRVVWVFAPLIPFIMVGINIFLLPIPFIFDILVISIIIYGLFGYFFVTETYNDVWINIGSIYETNNGKEKFVRYILLKKFNTVKKDKELDEVLKCTYGLIAIMSGIVLGSVWTINIVYLPLIILLLISLFIVFLLFLVLIFHLRYVWKMPLNKPPEEEFPEWKYIGHMSANKLILICLIISAVPVLVIYSLWKIFLYLVGVFF